MAFYYGYMPTGSPYHVGYGTTSGCVPVYNLNAPGGGLQQPAILLAANTPIYSSYSGQLIGYGSVPLGTPTDAIKGQLGYGKNYHVVEYNPANGSHMAHRMQRP